MDTTLFIIVLGVGFFTMVFFRSKLKPKSENREARTIVQRKPLPKHCGFYDYLGGLDEYAQKYSVDIEVDDRNLLLKFLSAKIDNAIITIPLDNIIKVSTKMEDEISRDVTLARLLVFNIFAFGLKKERNHTQKFLIINYFDDQAEEKTLIFGGNNHPDKAYLMIKDSMNKLELKKA